MYNFYDYVNDAANENKFSKQPLMPMSTTYEMPFECLWLLYIITALKISYHT